MGARLPQPVVYTEGEMILAKALDLPTARLTMIKRCPDCDAFIIPCDNAIWLDAERAPADTLGLGIMEINGLMLAASAADGENGSRHSIHEHQPDEEGED